MTKPAAAPKGLRIAGIATAVVAVGAATIGLLARNKEGAEAQQWSDAVSIPTVHLIPVSGGDASGTLDLPGTTQAWESAKLYARVSGYVSAWYQDIGAEVRAGAPLGRIDTPELDQQIAQARAALASAEAHERLAKSTAERWNDLLTDNSVSRQEADEKNGDLAAKTAGVAAAEADLGRLLAMKEFSLLRAPFAGVVTARATDIGDLVGPGASVQQPLFSLADVSRVRVYVSVPQNSSRAIEPGVTATLTIPEMPGASFPAKVVGTADAINTRTGTLQVELAADNPDQALKPGGYVEVHFALPNAAHAVQIPASSLLFRAEGAQVALVGEGDRIKLQPVTIGRDLGPTVEIKAGLASNQKVVDNPPDSLAAGELVRVAQTKS